MEKWNRMRLKSLGIFLSQYKCMMYDLEQNKCIEHLQICLVKYW